MATDFLPVDQESPKIQTNVERQMLSDESRVDVLDQGLDDLYKVLRRDDAVGYEELISARGTQTDIIVNSKFSYELSREFSRSRERALEFQLPLHVCVASAGSRCFRLLLRDGADITRRDVSSCNILHTIILACSERLDDEDEYLHLLRIVLKELHSSQLSLLTHQCNKDGFKPVELAVRLGTFGLFSELLSYPGILVHSSADIGVNSYQLYDITEYEDFQDRRRTLRSPLRLMVYIHENSMGSFRKYQISKIPVLKRWMWYKVCRNMPFLILWFLFRLIFYLMLSQVDPSNTLYSLYCTKHLNMTEEMRRVCDINYASPRDIARTINFAYYSFYVSILVLLVDAVELAGCFFDKERRQAYRGLYTTTSFVSYTLFYRGCQFLLLSLCVILVPVALYWKGNSAAFIHFSYLVMTACLLLTIVSLMFFIELIPIFGLFAITLQQMITSCLVFLIFIGLVKIMFAQFMTMVAQQHGFSSVSMSMYVLFKMETGSSPFPDRPEDVMMVIHFVYYIISAILLLNYLIAVMSSLATNTAEDRESVQMLRRLDVVFTVEERYGQWFWRLIRRFRGRKKILIDSKTIKRRIPAES